MKLVVFEKMSQMTTVVKALNFQKNGNFYEGTFNGDTYRCIPLAGHVLESLPPDVINPDLSWDSIEHLDKLPTNIPMRVHKDKSRYISDFKKALHGVTEFVISGDPDREGVAICLEVKDFLNINLPVSGLWFINGLDPENVKKAFKNPKPYSFFKSIYAAQKARSLSDYYWMYLVRLYTWFGRNGALTQNLGSGGSKSSVISVGRVQTTLVNIIKERDELVISYKPIGIYNFQIIHNDIEFNYQHEIKLNELSPEHSGYTEDREKVYFVDQQLAQNFKNKINQNGQLSIDKVTKKEFTENAPDVFSTKDLWAHCSKKLKFSSKKTQLIAESLYRDGFMSYPRTKGSHIPKESFSVAYIKGVLASHKNHNTKLQFEVLSSVENNNFIPNVFRKVDSAHEGIVPTGKDIKLLDLNSEVFKDLNKKVKVNEQDVFAIFNEIFERFCISCLRPATGFKCDVVGTVQEQNLKGENKSTFKTNSKFYEKLGFLKWHSPSKKTGETNELFIPEEGTTIEFDQCQIKKGKTKKYEHFNDITLPEAMSKVSKKVDDPLLAKVLEKADGIGTEATIVSIIDLVINREYVEKIGDVFKITNKGTDLIQIVEEQLCSPQLAAAWEMRINEIEEQKDPLKAEELRDLFLAKQRYFIEQKVKIITQKFIEDVGKYKVVRYSGDGKPSAKQVAFAKKLSKDKSLVLSPKTLKSVVETKKFIDKALSKK